MLPRGRRRRALSESLTAATSTLCASAAIYLPQGARNLRIAFLERRSFLLDWNSQHHWLFYSVRPESNRRRHHSLDNRRTLLSPNYLHGVLSLDAHHRHREAPPDQQDAGRSLKLEADCCAGTDAACCVFSGGAASATFVLERESGGSFDA